MGRATGEPYFSHVIHLVVLVLGDIPPTNTTAVLTSFASCTPLLITLCKGWRQHQLQVTCMPVAFASTLPALLTTAAMQSDLNVLQQKSIVQHGALQGW